MRPLFHLAVAVLLLLQVTKKKHASLMRATKFSGPTELEKYALDFLLTV